MADNGSSLSAPTSVTVNELPKSMFWDAMEICNWEGFWFETGLAKSAITFHSTFQAHDDDVVLASTIKTGTTWLKALTLCILKNPIHNYQDEEDILIKDNPQFHVQTIENTIYSTKPSPDLYTMPRPRLFHTHLPFTLLPNSIKSAASNCKMVYIARNPKDTFVSLWHFFNSIFRPNNQSPPFPIERALDGFCSGVQHYGPYFENVVSYWAESKKRPERMLFLKYEEMKRDPHREVRKLGLFLGKPFGSEEEVEKVVWRCSLERLKGLDVNNNGSGCVYGVPNSAYFRLGVVGDWKNYLTQEMGERIDQVARFKFQGSGLHFEE